MTEKHLNVARIMNVFMAILITFSLNILPVYAQSGVETLILFDPGVPEVPESIVFDKSNNAYVALSRTGEIRKITPELIQSTHAILPFGSPCNSFPAAISGLAIDRRDNIYVSVNACDPAYHGIWQVSAREGAISLLANLPYYTEIEGIDVSKKYIYAADTYEGIVWRISVSGGLPEIWAYDPLLKRPPGAYLPGANGLRISRRKVFVSNTATENIVAIPIHSDGSAGQALVYASSYSGYGCDEFEIDNHGRILCASPLSNALIRIVPQKSTEILLTSADLLDIPTSVSFGRKGKYKNYLYITNSADPDNSLFFRPSLMRILIDIK